MVKKDGKWISNEEALEIAQDNYMQAQSLIKECMVDKKTARKEKGLLICLGQLINSEGREIERIEKIKAMKEINKAESGKITIIHMDPPSFVKDDGSDDDEEN